MVVFSAVVNWWVGVPGVVDRIATHWLRVASENGFPSEYDRLLYYTTAFFAFFIVVASWFVAAFITTWLTLTLVYRVIGLM